MTSDGDLFLQSPGLRNDLRHLLSHGRYRFEASKQMVEAFRTTNERLPRNVSEIVQWLDSSEGRPHLAKLKKATFTHPVKSADHKRRLAKERTNHGMG
jgi:hypothetical protein